MDASGANQRRLVLPVGVASFTWAPDGKQLAVGADRGPAQPVGIWLIRPDGTGARPFTPNCTAAGTCSAPSARAPSWSPDGSRIAYLEDGVAGIRIRTKDGGSLLSVDVPSTCCTPPTAFSWSPDGTFFAFATTTSRSDGLGNENRTGVVAVSGGTPTLLTPQGADVTFPSWRP